MSSESMAAAFEALEEAGIDPLERDGDEGWLSAVRADPDFELTDTWLTSMNILLAISARRQSHSTRLSFDYNRDTGTSPVTARSLFYKNLGWYDPEHPCTEAYSRVRRSRGLPPVSAVRSLRILYPETGDDIIEVISTQQGLSLLRMAEQPMHERIEAARGGPLSVGQVITRHTVKFYREPPHKLAAYVATLKADGEPAAPGGAGPKPPEIPAVDKPRREALDVLAGHTQGYSVEDILTVCPELARVDPGVVARATSQAALACEHSDKLLTLRELTRIVRSQS